MDFPEKFADRIMADKIHALSLSFLVKKLHKQFGGTAGNIAYSLKLLGYDPYIIAPSGNDFSSYDAFLNKMHMHREGITRYGKESTGTYFCITDKEDNQIGAFYGGAIRFANSLSLVRFAKKERLSLKKDSLFAILAPNDPNAMILFVRECRKFHIPYLYDPAFQIGNFTNKQLIDGIANASLVIGNDYEIALIEKNLHITHAQLLEKAPIVITTLGSKGSFIETKKEKYSIHPAKVKNTTDPTGAGDAYRSGFLAGYLRGFDLQTCGQMGSVAASYTVEKYGTMTHTYTKKQFEKRYKENYKTDIEL